MIEWVALVVAIISLLDAVYDRRKRKRMSDVDGIYEPTPYQMS